ncbi:MAG TPA: UDP-N-acetylmuramoyl-L-alanyl-D-glutamate--2,6-diaminopimelate ligase [Christensenellaceae bacterium]|nr:UDP-N-acetylmuramoyl-L-alanyl-D-glutamate--2,6-diaminopimelate ligase [Christensenellaceae bacterium]
MLLSILAEAAKEYFIDIDGDCQIKALSQDSREKNDDALFFCVRGSRFDAHDFAEDAVKNGAVALVVEKKLTNINVPQVLVSDVRAAMGLMASKFFGNPASKLKLVGITGTKGKTTTSYFIKSILDAAGIKNGVIGTTGGIVGDEKIEAKLTTPDPIDLHRMLSYMLQMGAEVVCMEVSAHAIDMKRVMGVQFEAACYTNLSQDHLDYFDDMQSYFEAKKRFIISEQVKNLAINADDETSEAIMAELRIPYSSYGISANADIFARDIEINDEGVSFALSLWNEQWYPVHINMMGTFNVYNSLAATAISLIPGIKPEFIVKGIESVRVVPGRAEVLETSTPYKVIVDYSHSPAALENILRTVKSFTKHKLILLFGCGGDRDHQKRPIMGSIAGKFADFTIITSDNPRTEEPMKIISEIEEGIKSTDGKYILIENRSEAIRHALDISQEGDVVILAGKGDETYQEIQGQKYLFNEKNIVSEILYEKKQSKQVSGNA